MGAPRPLMYSTLARWYHLLTPPDDYVEEAAEALRLLEDAADGTVTSLLELGTGGGNLVSHLPDRIALTLTDPAAEMLDVSRSINPAARHVVGDMRDLRLGVSFDAVLAHDAIGYMLDETDLRAAIETAFVHLRPGGAVLFAPDWVLDTFAPRTESGGSDAADGRGLRYLEWDRRLEPDGHTVVTDYIIVTREADGTTTVHHDEHRLGIFTRATWLRLLADVGFEAERVDGAAGLDLFVGRRPGSSSPSMAGSLRC